MQKPFCSCADQSLFTHIGITLLETLASFFFCGAPGTSGFRAPLGLPKISRVLEPYLVVLNSLPKIRPPAFIVAGRQCPHHRCGGYLCCNFGSIINLYTGFRQVDTDQRKLIRTLGGNKRQELTKVVLPASVPLILSTMKVNIGLCLVGVIIGEFIGARQGFGYLIIYGSQTFKLTWSS